MNNNQYSQGVVSPRIYTYKITFKDTPFYYYGVHKEKRFNEDYYGTPYTNKWCWDLYEAEKQILEVFDYTDEGWIGANNVEKRLISPVLNTDPYCLNDNVGGVLSFSAMRKNGKKAYEEKRGIHALSYREELKKMGQKAYEKKTGIHALSKEQRQEIARKNGKKYGGKGGKKTYENKTGIFSLSKEERKTISTKVGKEAYEKKTGIHGLSKEERKRNASNAAKVSASVKYRCLVTGHISNAGPLSSYQKARGIDTSMRERLP